MKSHPRQHCKMCSTHDVDNSEHVLMHCARLNDVRDRHLENVQLLMPELMSRDFRVMNARLKCRFLISGLNNVYVSEWDPIYGAISDFVWQMYTTRHKTYANERI